MVHVGLRDKFPVQTADERVLFRVAVPEATDERFVLEIQTEAGSRRIELLRDKPVTTEVGGERYEFFYTTPYVSCSAGKTTTNKAQLIISRLPQS